MKDISKEPEPDKMPEAEKDRQIAEKHKAIPGWGIDADPQDKPNYPIKDWNGADHLRFNYPKPAQQAIHVEVLHSNERPGISRVFGSSVPPQGISGALRRFAFRYSESTYMHWLPLVVADRIGVIEGMIDDYKNGTSTNPYADRFRAEWKYNRTNMIAKIAVATVAVAVIGTIFWRRKKIGTAIAGGIATAIKTAKDTAGMVKEAAIHTAEAAKHSAGTAADKASHVAKHTMDTVKHKAADFAHR